MNLMNIYLTIKVYFCHIKVHACFKKIISRKKHFLIIRTCVYLVLSAVDQYPDFYSEIS